VKINRYALKNLTVVGEPSTPASQDASPASLYLRRIT